MLPTPASSAGGRRSPSILISVPGSNQPSSAFAQVRPPWRLVTRYLPWVVGCTILFWYFVLRTDNHPPQWEALYPPPLIHHDPPHHTKAPWRAPWHHTAGPTDHQDGSSNTKPKAPKVKSIWDGRAEAVKEAFIFAYSGYDKWAKGSDELLPVSGRSTNNFNGWGVTLFDSLDTMWIMGLHDLFQDSVAVVANSTFHNQPYQYTPFFETIIRYLGGLLSAYALSGEPILLSRADDLGRKLLPAFNSTHGIPMFAVHTGSGETRKGWLGDSALWAEATSNQMEFKYLAHLTGRKEYFNKTEDVMRRMYSITLENGMFPTMWNYENGLPTNRHYSVGAYADSGYEYFLKQWLLTSRSEPQTLQLYLKSTEAIIKHLLYITPQRNLLYVTDITNDVPSHTLEHLSCFLPGLFALGVNTLSGEELSQDVRELHLWAAKGLAETCWVTYADTQTGLGPDEVRMNAWLDEEEWRARPKEDRERLGMPGDVYIGGKWLAHVDKWKREGRVSGSPPGTRHQEREPDPQKRDWSLRIGKETYLLRPETIETFYILWKVTGDTKWRERGWSIFEAIQEHAKTQYGYASVNFVDKTPPGLKDEMPSYFLAETLKYLYLLFSEVDIIPFDYWVLNTEAHPLPRFNWTSWEKKLYGIQG